jgi:hypothetical protein
MKYTLECNECGSIQESNNWIPLTPCNIHRERLNPEDDRNIVCDSPDLEYKENPRDMQK